MYEYDLFAVINHEGQINNGHYTNYARFNDEVKFDEPVQLLVLADIFGSGTALTMTSKSNFVSFLNVSLQDCFFFKKMRISCLSTFHSE
jgi:ubiquitin C-terminal hydrolase